MALTDTSALRGQMAARAAETNGDGNLPAEHGDGKPLSPSQQIRAVIDRQGAAFQAVMPRGVDPERFARLVLTAVKSTPELRQCFATPQGEVSVLIAAMQAAALGLEPNTPTQECWLLPRKNKGVWECQLSIGYRGLIKLARRSGEVATVYAEAVHERDHFEWSRGLERDRLEFRPCDDDDPGELTHAFAVVRFKDGTAEFRVLNRRQVEARRAMSDSWKNPKSRPYSPWAKWEEAMWRKSAIRELAPYMNLTTEASTALQVDEQRLKVEGSAIVIDQLALGASRDDEDDDEVEQFDGPTVEVIDEATGEVMVPAPAEPEPDDEPAGEPEPDDPGDLPAFDYQRPADALPPPGEDPNAPKRTEAQGRALHKLLRDKHNASGPLRFPILSAILERDVTSTSSLSVAEASYAIDVLQTGEAPPADDPDGEEPF